MTSPYRKGAERPPPSYIFLLQHRPGYGNGYSHVVYREGRQHADAALDDYVAGTAVGASQCLQVWVGELFYDHTRGAVDCPLVPGDDVGSPFLVVSFQDSFDYTGHGRYVVEEFSDPEAALELAKQLPGDEVYGVCVLRHQVVQSAAPAE